MPGPNDGVGVISANDYLQPQPGARRMPNGLVVLCHTRAIVHFKDEQGEALFQHLPEHGSHHRYGVIKSCEPYVEDGRATGHNGLHEVPNYDTLPRDLRPKPRVKDGSKMMVLDQRAKNPHEAPRVIATEQYVDPATGELVTEMEDWGMLHFSVCNPVTFQPDPELEAKYEADYRKRHGLKQPIERKKMLQVVIRDYPDDERRPPETIADQLLMERIKEQDKTIDELKAMVEKLLKAQAA